MHVLGLILALGSGVTSAAEWQTASSLPHTHLASAGERAVLIKLLRNSLIVYNFEDGPFLIHDGDVRIEGNFDNDAVLVVRGNFTVDGMYDDHRSDTGVLVVLGDMHVRNVFSAGAMHVQGNLTAAGLLMTAYEDFPFEVVGKVNARALVISDKSNNYTAGDIDLEWSGDRHQAVIAQALRTFEPILFTHPTHLELEDDSDISDLDIDEARAHRRMAAGEQIFRTRLGDEALPQWAQAAIDPATSIDALEALIGNDALVDQLIAARATLPRSLAVRLLASGDAVVLGWLGQTAPQVVLAADSSAMTPDAATALVGHAETSEEDLQRIAAHPDPLVRIALAERNELSAALINRLAADADPKVRAAVIDAQFNALELEPDVLKSRLGDDAQAVPSLLPGSTPRKRSP